MCGNIPTDDSVKKLGVPLASKCLCCAFPDVKLNVGGACRGNPGVGGGGGIIRNGEGKILAAFANYYGACNNSIAVFRALRDGLKLCAEMGFSDSSLVVHSVSTKRCNIWKGWYWFHEIMTLVQALRPMVTFTFREGNRAADWLANYACDSVSSTTFTDWADTPTDLRKIIWEDAAGLPVIRT
ncbi:ribonuclease H-like [Telopea speciosissima]|uniref:ribonuclease H-like n=1 Tax=Telopea speciosissima TaxID=54955 RepID=UPI001CC644F9|nr:ribonuclease H-like [Telopea speciosissima]